MMNKMTMAVVVAAVLATGCGSSPRARFINGGREGIGAGPTYSEGLTSASFDMGCPKEKLEVVELGATAVGVSGCGKSVRYEAVEGHWLPMAGKRDEASK